jgi:hypothetical protein
MSGILDDFKNSVTGNIEPAYIVVHDCRAAAGGGETGGVSMPELTAGALAGEPNAPAGASQEKLFRVQYNPSELSLSATASSERVRDLRAREDGTSPVVQESPLAGTIELSMSLWFDKMSAATSFMLDKTAAPTSAAGAANLVKSFMKEASVRDEVEGFIAALRNPHTQCISVHWADFTFPGVLYSVNAQYTMFSVTGLPVRAKVSIRVRQEANTHAIDTWVKRDFDAAFGGDQSNLVRPEQQVSNLLNLGL